LTIYQKHTTRLGKHNYSVSETYAITIGSFKHYWLFGDIYNGKIIKNKVYEIIYKNIIDLPKKYKIVKILNFQIMPNHIHLIIKISSIGLSEKNNLSKSSLHMQSYNICPTLGQIIAYLKYNITKEVNSNLGDPATAGSPYYEGKLFLRGYFDHIIRDKNDLIAQMKYIDNNPKNWFYDEFNKNKKRGS
jgi:REP element-mobilizing transposase RayT